MKRDTLSTVKSERKQIIFMPTNITRTLMMSDDFSGYTRYNSSKGKTMVKSVLPVGVVKTKMVLLTKDAAVLLMQYLMMMHPRGMVVSKDILKQAMEKDLVTKTI